MLFFRKNKYRYTRSMVYDYSRVARVQSRRNRRNKTSKLFTISVLFCLITLALYLYTGAFSDQRSANQLLSPLVAPIQQSVDTSIKEFTALFSSGLKNIVESKFEGVQGTYAVYVKNLKTGEQYAYNENEEFLTASLYKLWTMGAVYDQIETGKLEKSKTLSASIESLNKQFNIATEEAELTEGEITRTIDEALEQMITISHNYSALLLTSTVRLATVRDFIDKYGFGNTVFGNNPPKSTAVDVAKFYELLYNKEIVNEMYSEEMMARLKRQRLNDRIPAKLPDNIQIAHKTGELYGYKHDAGIVFAPSGDYIIVMMSETKNPGTAIEVMAELSEEVYDYFEAQ